MSDGKGKTVHIHLPEEFLIRMNDAETEKSTFEIDKPPIFNEYVISCVIQYN